MKRTSRDDSIFQLKATLDGIAPSIWRRLLVPASVKLNMLHDILQVAFGWKDCHMHLFEVRGVEYAASSPDDEMGMKDERRLSLDKALPAVHSKIRYEYDFGDSWGHTIVLEKTLPREEGLVYPVCVDGARSGPPEDVGGVWGYAEFLEAIADPEHEMYEEYTDWIGGDFDPEKFDGEFVNKRLKRLKL